MIGSDVDGQLAATAGVSLNERRHLIVTGCEPNGDAASAVRDNDADDLREWSSFRADLPDPEACVREGMPALTRRLTDAGGAGAAVADLCQATQQPETWLRLRCGSQSDAAREQGERSDDGRQDAHASYRTPWAHAGAVPTLADRGRGGD